MLQASETNVYYRLNILYLKYLINHIINIYIYLLIFFIYYLYIIIFQFYNNNTIISKKIPKNKMNEVNTLKSNKSLDSLTYLCNEQVNIK